MKIFVSIVIPLLFLYVNSNAQTNTIEENGRVIDSVSILNKTQKQKLSETLQDLEKNTGSRLIVLIIDTLNGESIEDYSYKKANELWHNSTSRYANGILITVAMKDRKMRIEVGRDLESIVPDEFAARIIKEDMVPNFKAGKIYEGLYISVKKIQGKILSGIK